jgi:hypothetical protein
MAEGGKIFVMVADFTDPSRKHHLQIHSDSLRGADKQKKQAIFTRCPRGLIPAERIIVGSLIGMI